MSQQPSQPIRRLLTDTEMTGVLTAIAEADSTPSAIAVTVTATFTRS
jgi:hypothetical protein